DRGGRGEDLVPQLVGGRADVDRLDDVGGDELHRGGGVLLVLLHPVGQPDGHEAGLAAGRGDTFAGALAQPRGDGRVDPAADPQDEPLGAGVLEVAGEEVDAPFRLGGGVERVGVDDLEGGDDLRLELLVRHSAQSSGGDRRSPAGGTAGRSSGGGGGTAAASDHTGGAA